MPNFKVTDNRSATTGAIGSLAPATYFMLVSSSKGNNGPCLRVKDSKRGKNRFVNVTNGKLLTAEAGDRIEEVSVELVISNA